MKDRVIRFGLTGLTFILSLLFGLWYFGGQIDFTDTFTSSNIVDLVGIVIPIITSPIIGFIISSTGLGLIEHCWPKRTVFLKPTDGLRHEYLKLIHDNFLGKGSGITFDSEDNTYSIYDHNLVYLNHQTLFRQVAENEVMEFTLRRMDLYRGYENTAFSIIYGLILGFFINLYSLETLGQFSLTKMLWIIPIIAYLVFGILQARKALKDSNEFEKRILLTRSSDNAPHQKL